MRWLANPPLSSSGEDTLTKYRKILCEHRLYGSVSNCIRPTGYHDASADPLSCLPSKRPSSEAQFGEQSPQQLETLFSWTMQKHLRSYDPSVPVKLVGEEEHAPRHLEDEEEQALVAAVINGGTVSGVAWLSLSRSIDLRKSWAMTRWIQLDSLFKGRNMIYNKQSKL